MRTDLTAKCKYCGKRVSVLETGKRHAQKLVSHVCRYGRSRGAIAESTLKERAS